MTTLHTAVQTYLKADTDILASPSKNRVYVDRWMPVGYQLTNGPIIVLTPRGGPGSVNYVMENASFVFRSFAVNQSEAFEIDEAIFRAFLKTHNPANASSIYAKDTISPSLDRDPNGGIWIVSTTYAISRVIS